MYAFADPLRLTLWMTHEMGEAEINDASEL
jgi:hypothetical protein